MKLAHRVALGILIATVGLWTYQSATASPNDLTGTDKEYVVRIAPVAMSPSSIEIPIDARVTFVNNDPHLAHHMASACPEVDNVGRLEPGESGHTAPFTESKTCKYQDRLHPGNPLRSGKIIVR